MDEVVSLDRLKLVLADYDSRYLHKLAEYINKYFPARIRVHSFTRADILEAYLNSLAEPIDILLAHPDYLPEPKEAGGKIGLLLALGDGQVGNDLEQPLRLDRYLPGDKLVNRLIALYAEKCPQVAALAVRPKATRLVAVYSPAGGAGKTSIALGLAGLLSEMGRSVLCVSLESINSMDFALTRAGNSALTQILLAFEKNPESLPVKIESLKTRDELSGIEFIESPDCFLDISGLAGEQLRSFLERLKKVGKYDFVVLDTDTVAGANTLTVFDACDTVVLVLTPDRICRLKAKSFYEQLSQIRPDDGQGANCGQVRLVDKLCPILNKYESKEGYHPDHYCPEPIMAVPAASNLWTEADDGIVFNNTGEFRKNLAGLAQLFYDGGWE